MICWRPFSFPHIILTKVLVKVFVHMCGKYIFKLYFAYMLWQCFWLTYHYAYWGKADGKRQGIVGEARNGKENNAGT